jgi:hypothetical protein
MNQHPLPSLEELIEESLHPRALRERLGLPHPLSNFATNGAISDGPYADAVLNFMQDLTAEPESVQHRAAEWFLFESEKAFFFACSEAGIDAKKLRSHLESCRRSDPR